MVGSSCVFTVTAGRRFMAAQVYSAYNLEINPEGKCPEVRENWDADCLFDVQNPSVQM